MFISLICNVHRCGIVTYDLCWVLLVAQFFQCSSKHTAFFAFWNIAPNSALATDDITCLRIFANDRISLLVFVVVPLLPKNGVHLVDCVLLVH